MMEQPLTTTVGDALWRQFGAAIDRLEIVLMACPDPLWHARLWPTPVDRPPQAWFPAEFAEFWHVAYHTLFWLDLYLEGVPEEAFSPPAPFIWTEANPAVSPEQPYTREELRGYLTALRRKCYATFSTLMKEQALRAISHYAWIGQAISFIELQLYNLRHVEEHAAQLSLFLGQHGVSGEALGWVTRAKDDPDSY